MIWNTSFDPAVLSYDAEYENSLHFSEAFRGYTDELVERLIGNHDLAASMLPSSDPARESFWPSSVSGPAAPESGSIRQYDGESDDRAGGRVSFVRDLLRPGAQLGEPSLVVTRHVVEHLEDPVAVLSDVRRALGQREATLYVEVPAAEYLVEQDAIWDIIYPHVTCLTAPALRAILERAGFQPQEHGYAFGGQYLWVEASTAAPVRAAADPGRVTEHTVTRFADRLSAKRAEWADRLPRLLAGGSVALWGAGAKGATFLNLVEGGDSIEAVIDVNPRKQGKYVPGTGQLIVGPSALTGRDVSAVVVMNPVYATEIHETLRGLGIEAELVLA